jgi:hypothetical protein
MRRSAARLRGVPRHPSRTDSRKKTVRITPSLRAISAHGDVRFTPRKLEQASVCAQLDGEPWMLSRRARRPATCECASEARQRPFTVLRILRGGLAGGPGTRLLRRGQYRRIQMPRFSLLFTLVLTLTCTAALLSGCGPGSGTYPGARRPRRMIARGADSCGACVCLRARGARAAA